MIMIIFGGTSPRFSTRAMISPIVVSQLAETVATCLISSLSFTFLAILSSTSRPETICPNTV